ncbi:MAG: hypothetical protein R2827_00495 [Bdellovibrionales bacterium]
MKSWMRLIVMSTMIVGAGTLMMGCEKGKSVKTNLEPKISTGRQP